MLLDPPQGAPTQFFAFFFQGERKIVTRLANARKLYAADNCQKRLQRTNKLGLLTRPHFSQSA